MWAVLTFGGQAFSSLHALSCHHWHNTPFLNVSLWFLFFFCLYRVFPLLTFSQCTSIVYLHQAQQQDVSVFPKAVFGFLSLFLLAMGLGDRAHFYKAAAHRLRGWGAGGQSERRNVMFVMRRTSCEKSPLWTMMHWECLLHKESWRGCMRT